MGIGNCQLSNAVLFFSLLIVLDNEGDGRTHV